MKMPPSAAVSPTQKNENNINEYSNVNSANDVMNALSLAMANALLDSGPTQSRYRDTIPDNIGSSVSEAPSVSTEIHPSRVSPNEGISIWGSTPTTTSSYDFIPISNEKTHFERQGGPNLLRTSDRSVGLSSMFSAENRETTADFETYRTLNKRDDYNFSHLSSQHDNKLQMNGHSKKGLDILLYQTSSHVLSDSIPFQSHQTLSYDMFPNSNTNHPISDALSNNIVPNKSSLLQADTNSIPSGHYSNPQQSLLFQTKRDVSPQSPTVNPNGVMENSIYAQFDDDRKLLSPSFKENKKHWVDDDGRICLKSENAERSNNRTFPSERQQNMGNDFKAQVHDSNFENSQYFQQRNPSHFFHSQSAHFEKTQRGTSNYTRQSPHHSPPSASYSPLSFAHNRRKNQETLINPHGDEYHTARTSVSGPPFVGMQVNGNQHNQGNFSTSQQMFVMAMPVHQGHNQVLQPMQMVPIPQVQPMMIPGPNGFNAIAPGPFSSTFEGCYNQQRSKVATNEKSSWQGLKPTSPSMNQMHYGVHQQRFIGAPPSPYMGMESGTKKEKRNKIKNPNALKQEVVGTESFPFSNENISKNDFGYQMYGLSNMIDSANMSPSESIAALYHSAQRPPLAALLGHVRRLSRDQVGCRLLQQSLDEDGPQAATSILNEGLSFLAETMTDPFGNYLFQKILEKVTEEERLKLITAVSSRLVNAALNLHGTRSVQKVVELSVSDDRDGLHPAAEVVTRALSPAAARLCIDSHGNHVIQRVLQKFPHQHSKFIFDAVATSVGDVARHRHGCCVIQRCLDSPVTQARSNLVKRIVDKALDLMQDAYGNYVVQYVLDVCSDNEAAAVCESVVGRVGLLAIQKFSSNVMEKCLERSSDWVQELYLRELSSPEKIRELMADPFGNYVVQRALSVATHGQAIRLVEAMRPHLHGMRNTAGGRRIVAKICRRFPDFDLNFITEQYVSPTKHSTYFNNKKDLDKFDSGATANMGAYVLNDMNGNH